MLMKIDFLLIGTKIVLKILLIKKCAYNSSTLFYPVPFNPLRLFTTLDLTLSKF